MPFARTEVDEVRAISDEKVLSVFRCVVTSNDRRVFDSEFAAIHTIKERTVTSMRMFATRAEALEAAGLSE